MVYALKMQLHEAAAVREYDAALKARCVESARRHSEMATLHKREADRITAVRAAIQIAFGD